MISQELHNIFTEALKDKEYKGKPALSFVVEYDKTADSGKVSIDKLETANAGLQTERDSLKEKYKTAANERDTLKTDNEKLSKNQKTDKDKTVVEKGMSEEKEAEFNSLKESVRLLTEGMAKTQKTLETERIAKGETDFISAKTSLESELIRELAGVKIKDKGSVDAALGIVDRNGHAKINKEDDGVLKRFITTKAENGDTTTASVKELASYLAKAYPKLVDSSGKSGTGEDHQRETDQTGKGNSITKDHTRDLMNAEANL